MDQLNIFVTNHPLLTAAVVIVLLLLTIVEALRMKRSSSALSATEVTHKINHDNAVIIDLRSNDAYRKGHIIDALSIPASDILNATKKLDKFKSKPIIFVCQRGMESQKITTQLQKQGYNVHTLSGGITAWVDAQLPLVKD